MASTEPQGYLDGAPDLGLGRSCRYRGWPSMGGPTLHLQILESVGTSDLTAIGS
jgi:hypothetical protein